MVAAWLHPAGGGLQWHNQAKRPVIIITSTVVTSPRGSHFYEKSMPYE